MRRSLLSLTLVGALLLACAGVAVAQQTLPVPSRTSEGAFVPPSDAEDSVVPGEILVKFKPGTPGREQAQAHQQNGGREKQTIRELDVKVVSVRSGQEQAAVDAYNSNPNVEYAELNGVATVSVDPNDYYYANNYASAKHGDVHQWGWKKIQADQAWDKTKGSSSVRVAVVDSGIDTSHPDLPKVTLRKDYYTTNNAEDDHGHGTHVAGTLGASTNNYVSDAANGGVAGTNWNVELMAVKALNKDGSGSYANIADGILWAANNGAKVINLSLGGTYNSTTLSNAVDRAWRKGAVLACAAGNSNTSTKHYPAAYTNCIAVGATDESDQRASFSNYGTGWVDIGAPGYHILSTLPNTTVSLNGSGYKQTYDSLNGTSMATPHVAGVAGLVWAAKNSSGANICSSNSCVRNQIESKADQVSGLVTNWPDGRRLNALKSVSP